MRPPAKELAATNPTSASALTLNGSNFTASSCVAVDGPGAVCERRPHANRTMVQPTTNLLVGAVWGRLGGIKIHGSEFPAVRRENRNTDAAAALGPSKPTARQG